VNLNAPFYIMKRAIPYMKRFGSVTILNISTFRYGLACPIEVPTCH